MMRLPSSAALATLGSAAKVRALFDDLGAHVSRRRIVHR